MKMNECGCGCGGNTEMCSNYKESNLNYMFLGNLETIKRMIDEMVQMDARQVDEILKGGHDWAVDHIASSVDDIQEVYNFLKNRVSVSMDNKMDPFAEPDILIKTFESFVNEAKKKDQDDDGDSDFADAKIAQYIAGGMSRKEAIKKSRKFNKK